jgi:hypothetical protein
MFLCLLLLCINGNGPHRPSVDLLIVSYVGLLIFNFCSSVTYFVGKDVKV